MMMESKQYKRIYKKLMAHIRKHKAIPGCEGCKVLALGYYEVGADLQKRRYTRLICTHKGGQGLYVSVIEPAVDGPFIHYPCLLEHSTFKLSRLVELEEFFIDKAHFVQTLLSYYALLDFRDMTAWRYKDAKPKDRWA
jgi:hypothetical protein